MSLGNQSTGAWYIGGVVRPAREERMWGANVLS